MLNVSNDFKTAISAPYRVIRGRCTLAYDYPFITGTVTSSTENANSDRAKVVDGIGLSDYYNDGKFRGFQSSATCNASNVFTTAQTLTVDFAETNISYTQVVGDNVTGQYPVDFTVAYQNIITLNSTNTTQGRAVLGSGVLDTNTNYGRSGYITIKNGDTISYNLPTISGFQPTARITVYDSSNVWLYDAIPTLVSSATVTIANANAAKIIITLYLEGNAYSSWGTSWSGVFTNFKKATTTVTNNALLKWSETVTTIPCTRLLLTVTKWSAPSTTAKITAFTYRNTETFTGDDIIKMDITEEIEPEGGTIFGTAIAKKAEVTLSNFSDKFTNVQFLANRTFYPEYGADLTLVGLDDTFGINTAVDLEVEQDFTVATNTTWELEADKDLTVEDVTVGDYELIDNQMFADFDALPQRMEWCPMGIYYSNDWKLSDDRYSLSIQGLDAIGYLTTQTYTNAMTTDSSFDLQAYLDALLASSMPAYTTQTVYEADIDVEVNFKLIAGLKTKLNTFNLRDYLNNLSLTGLVAKASGTPNLYTKFGISYIQSSRWERKILLIGKFSEPKAIDQYTNFIADYNSFKLKNYRNDKNMINTFRVETLEGVVLETFVPARLLADGKVAETVPNTSFINSDNQMNISLYILPRLYASQQSECNAEWQGNPAWELGDDVSVQIPRRGTQSAQAELNQGYIVANHFKYSGGLRCTTRTKILRTDEVAG